MKTLVRQDQSWSSLIERQGPLNLLAWSEAFDNAAWAKGRSYVVANCATDPVTGLYTVDKLVEDGTADNTHYMVQNITQSAPLTYVVRAKAAGRTWLYMYLGGNLGSGYFNLGAGTVGAKSAAVITAMFDAGGGWWDCVIYAPTGSDTTNVQAYLAEGDSDITFSGLGHQGTAAAGGSTTTAVLAAGASAVDSVYNSTEIIFSDAPTTIHTVTAYVGATLTATFTPARASTPDATTYIVGPGIYIARAQLNPGTTLRTYRKTTG